MDFKGIKKSACRHKKKRCIRFYLLLFKANTPLDRKFIILFHFFSRRRNIVNIEKEKCFSAGKNGCHVRKKKY